MPGGQGSPRQRPDDRRGQEGSRSLQRAADPGAALVIVTPGQDTALTIRNSLLGGRLSGLSTAVGVCVGQCAWALATSAGLAALLVASEPAFVALRLFGAAYLVLLGVQALRAAI